MGGGMNIDEVDVWMLVGINFIVLQFGGMFVNLVWQILKVKKCGVKLVVIDLCKIDVVKYVDIYLVFKFGNDLMVLVGFLRVIFKEGLYD